MFVKSDKKGINGVEYNQLYKKWIQYRAYDRSKSK